MRDVSASRWGARRVVTGNHGPGRSRFESDGAPEREDNGGPREIWQIAESPGAAAVAAHGKISWQIASLSDRSPVTSLRAGMERERERSSLEFHQVLKGRAELLLDEGRVEVGPGDTIVRRGASQRWRLLGDEPLVCSSTLLESAGSGDATQTWRHGPGARQREVPGDGGARRIVTGVGSDGRSRIEMIGEAPNAFRFEHGGGMAYADLWQTLGAVDSPAAGGDAPEGSVQLLPHGDGVAWKRLAMPPEAVRVQLDGKKLAEERQRLAPGLSRGGQHDREQPGRHRTDTLDLILMLEGTLRLSLDPEDHVDLAAGDCVVQQGAWHTWTNCGDVSCVFDVVMIARPPE